MSNRTAQQPPDTRQRSKTAARGASYRRTTARLEGRRDGTPLVFGWGRHLTRAQKTRYQQSAAFGFLGLIVVAVLGVVVFGIYQQKVVVPNQTIVSVDNSKISQETYRKYLAHDSQILWNKLQAELNQESTLAPKAANGDKTASTQDAAVVSHIQVDELQYTQTSLTQTAINELTEDQLIQHGAKQFEQQNHVPASTFEPSTAAVNKQLAAFKKAFPHGETYASFLSKDNLTDADVRAAITIHLRRDMMQSYLASQYKSPTKQMHLDILMVGSAADATTLRDQVVNQHADWAQLAKTKSVDPNTKNKGGDEGWVAPGTTDAAVEAWAFASDRKIGDVSPVIRDTSGTFDIAKVVAIDPSKAVASSALSNAKTNALAFWLGGQKVASSNHISTPSTSMMNGSRNLPVLPNLNAQLPNYNQQSSSSQVPAGASPIGG